MALPLLWQRLQPACNLVKNAQQSCARPGVGCPSLHPPSRPPHRPPGLPPHQAEAFRVLLQHKQRVMRRESCCICCRLRPRLRLLHKHCLEIAALGPIDTPSSDRKSSMGIILQRADAPRFPIGWLLSISIGPTDAAHRKTSAPKSPPNSRPRRESSGVHRGNPSTPSLPGLRLLGPSGFYKLHVGFLSRSGMRCKTWNETCQLHRW